MASEAESLKSQIQDLLSRDELLQGIPLDSTVEDLELLISAEKGEAWVIHVKKLDDRVIGNETSLFTLLCFALLTWTYKKCYFPPPQKKVIGKHFFVNLLVS